MSKLLGVPVVACEVEAAWVSDYQDYVDTELAALRAEGLCS